MKTRFIFLLIFSLLSAFAAKAQDVETLLRADVEFLADPSAEGRGMGEKGNQMAAFYIFDSFRRAGLWTRVQSFEERGRKGHNIIGFTPGYYDEWLVVGAYFDGLGKIDGKCYPGADSNASGVASLLELARRWRGVRGRTGVIYVAFDGHNAGMSGSREFVKEFAVSHKVRMMVNLDILGGVSVPVKENRPDYLVVLGSQGFTWQIFRANIGTRLNICYDYYGSSRFTDLFYNSMGDQKWFVQENIPSVMFTSGISMDTNKTSDTPDRLNYGIMASRVSVIDKWLKSQL